MNYPHKAKKYAFSILKWSVIILGVTYVTSFLVRLYMASKHIEPVGQIWGVDYSVLVSFMYTVIFISFNSISERLALKRASVFNWKNVLFYAGVQSASIILAFTFATFLSVLFYYYFVDNHEVQKDFTFLIFVFVMSFTAAFILNMITYAGYLYRNLLMQQRQAAEHQLAALKTQINPHFLFNSLNSIASLIRISPEKAEEVTEDLADLFRYSLRSGSQNLTNLINELESVNTYFRIEKARFGDRIQLVLHNDDDLQEIGIPSLVLQPLIENAVKHAANKMTEPCEIRVSIKKREKGILITISDNGLGFESLDPSYLFQKGTGLKNVNDRLVFTLGQESALRFGLHHVEFSIPNRKVEHAISVS
jgi:sensor histidine kinase YesM